MRWFVLPRTFKFYAAERDVVMKKFLKGIRGKQILVAMLAVMVIASGIYRWTMGKNSESVAVVNEELPVEEISTESEETAPDEGDYFALTRYERDCARSEALEILAVAAEFENDNAETSKKIEEHAENAEQEISIENMVKSKGFEDCVAFVNDRGVRVIVKATGLDAKGVATIKDVVVELTGTKPTDIKISNRN